MRTQFTIEDKIGARTVRAIFEKEIDPTKIEQHLLTLFAREPLTSDDGELDGNDGDDDRVGEAMIREVTPARIPYFDIGDATGAPGEIVEVEVEAGCEDLVTGFHIGGGLSGYGKFRAVGAKLGPYFQRYVMAEDAKLHDKLDEVGDHYFSKFNFVRGRPHRALPTEWWEFLVGLLSMEHRTMLGAIHIPFGTHLFTLMIEILPSTPTGVYELTCLDEWYYTNQRQRRRKFLFTNDRQGIMKIETLGGVLTVT